MNLQTSIDLAKKSIKDIFVNETWWQYVDGQAQKNILYIIDNIDTAGLLFKDAFRSGVKFKDYLHASTLSKSKQASVLFGDQLTEDIYQVGIEPAKFVLSLEDWAKPTEADVYVCFRLCEKIEMLEKMGLYLLIKALDIAPPL